LSELAKKKMKKYTISQIEEAGDIFYQRTHKLREIWQNELLPETKRGKAARLFFIMQNRVLNIAMQIYKARMPKAPVKYEKGGIDATH